MEDTERAFLESVKEYIREMEDRCESEWGSNRTLQELIDAGTMPDLYSQVLRRLESAPVNYVREALAIAEANSGDHCPLSSDACGEYFEQIRDLLRLATAKTGE